MTEPNSSVGELKAALQDMRSEVERLRHQLGEIEKSGNKGFELLKWGMGMFVTFAIVFAGFNWWTGKATYDRDRDNLKQQATLLEQKLSLYQQELATLSAHQTIDVQHQLETNFAKLTVSNDKQLVEIQNEARTNLQKLIAEKSIEFTAIFSNLSAAVTNLPMAVQAEIRQNRETTEKLLSEFANTNSMHITNLVAAVQKGLSLAEALTQSVQGNQFCIGNKMKTAEDFEHMGGGITAYVVAAKDWLIVGDEGSLRKLIARIETFVPIYLKEWNIGSLAEVEDTYGLANRLSLLVAELNKPEHSSRYTPEIDHLERIEKFYRKSLDEDRARTVTHIQRGIWPFSGPRPQK